MKRSVFFIAVFLILSTVFAGMVSAGFWEWIVGQDPNYSPFPDQAPFDVAVTVQPSNTAPEIQNLETEIYVCEARQLNHYFNVSDVDGNLDAVYGVNVDPAGVFFGEYLSGQSINQNVLEARLFSVLLRKTHLGIHSLNISVRDQGEQGVPNSRLGDSLMTDIEVLEINNPPEFEIQNQNVWTVGENSLFSRQLNVNDVEDGNALNYNLTITNAVGGEETFFDINPSGFIGPYTGFTGDLGIYTVEVCVEDFGYGDWGTSGAITLNNGDPTVCLLDDGVTLNEGQPLFECDSFVLTVTDQNREPIIDNYWNVNLTFNVTGQNNIYFNASAHDPDDPTIGDLTDDQLDFYWSVDDVLESYQGPISFGEFNYDFPCGIGGPHNVSLRVSDGDLNTSLVWNINVQASACSGGGGGGGGGGGTRQPDACQEQWGCLEWDVCQNATASLELGVLSQDDYDPIFSICTNGSIEGNCGFQVRNCIDVNACNSTFTQPDLVRQCYFTEGPSCNDGIENCHNGACEVLVDCGGPCQACATCSDGIENQGEQGIDCGGPCPNQCQAPAPPNYNLIRYVLIGIFFVFISIIIIKIVGIFRARRRVQNYSFEQQQFGYQGGFNETTQY